MLAELQFLKFPIQMLQLLLTRKILETLLTAPPIAHAQHILREKVLKDDQKV